MNKQNKTNFLLLLLMMLMSASISASIYKGTINIKVGETYRVSLNYPSDYTVAGGWTKTGGNAFVITSMSYGNGGCTIKGNQVGTSTLNWQGSIAAGWNVWSEEYYWIVEVVAAPPPENKIAIDATIFPDANFRSYLLEKNYGTDGVITESEIKSILYIDVSEKQISSLKGIEYFTALTTLWCNYNQLTSLDVSKNTALRELACNYNQLTSLDVSKNTALTTLWCNYNQLISLDFSENTALTTLWCNYNQLTSLDVSKNTALKTLRCISNQLTSLDFSKNTALTELSCNYNHLTTLDVSKNLVLQSLRCGSTQLTTLDISKNTALTYLACHDNQLASLDVSKNTALNTLYCYRNKISGSNMDNLISSLPQNETEKVYGFFLIDNSEVDEGNVCTKTQVAAVRAKGWTPQYYNGSEWLEYEGSDNEEPAGLKGDVNGDGEVSGTDLVALTNMILGKSEKKDAADLNGDGEVNGTDYVMLVNIVLGK